MTAPTIPDVLGTHAERVAAGAAYLDAERPGWWKRTDLARLDMSTTCQCVLGQEFGSFNSPQIKLSMEQMIACGFDSTGLPGDFEALAGAWVDLIEQRRADWSDAA